MKVAFLVPNVGVFGSVREVVECANALVRAGHRAYIYHPRGHKPEWISTLAECGNIAQARKRAHDILMFVRARNEDLVYTSLIPARVKAFYWMGLPEPERLEPITEDLKNRQGMRSLVTALWEYDAVANSTFQVDWLRENFGKPCTLLSGGINFDMFHPEMVAGRMGRILHSGDPRERKGAEDIADAWEIVIRERPNHVRGLHQYWYRNFSQDSLRLFYASGNVFVDGQHWAGWNNPVAEAMACGTPVVCTDIPGVRDFAMDKDTALLVGVRRPDQIANAIITLLDNPEFAYQMARRAHGYLKKNYSYDKVVARWLEELFERGGLR